MLQVDEKKLALFVKWICWVEDGGSGTRDSGADGALVSVPSETPKVLEAGNRGTISRNFMDLYWPLAAAGALFSQPPVESGNEQLRFLSILLFFALNILNE